MKYFLNKKYVKVICIILILFDIIGCKNQKNKFISEKGKALYLAVPRHKVLKACV